MDRYSLVTSRIDRSATTASMAIAVIAALAFTVLCEGLGTEASAPAVLGIAAIVGAAIGAVVHAGVVRPLLSVLAIERSARARVESELITGRQRRGFVEQLDTATDLADTEDEVLQIVGRTLAILMPERDNVLMLATADEPRVSWAIPATSEGLGEPRTLGSGQRCSALSLGGAVYSESSDSLDACPHLHLHDWETSSVCVPILVGDDNLGIAHSAGPPGELPDDETRRLLLFVTRRAGLRIAAMRAARRRDEQVSLDPLTRLPNHTVVHGRLRELIGGPAPFAVAFCDVDDFSTYNERNGNDLGDTALRLYAEVLGATLRPGDIVARYAGDRFLCLFPDCSSEHAASAMERVRESLVLEFAVREIEPFTVSVGVVDSEDGTCVEDLLENADVTLSVAKHSGGNRVSRTKFNSVGN